MKIYQPRSYVQPSTGLNSFSLREFRVFRNGRVTKCNYAVCVNDHYHPIYNLSTKSHGDPIWDAINSGSLCPVPKKNEDIVQAIMSIDDRYPFLPKWGRFFASVGFNEQYISLRLRAYLARGTAIRRGDFIIGVIYELECQFKRKYVRRFGLPEDMITQHLLGDDYDDFKKWKLMEFPEAFDDILGTLSVFMHTWRSNNLIWF